MNTIVHDSRFEHVSKILETPYVGKDKKKAYAPYGKEITMFKEQRFEPTLFPELLEEV